LLFFGIGTANFVASALSHDYLLVRVVLIWLLTYFVARNTSGSKFWNNASAVLGIALIAVALIERYPVPCPRTP
jgi:hypothetical protein